MNVKATFFGLETIIDDSLIEVDEGETFDIDFDGQLLTRFKKIEANT